MRGYANWLRTITLRMQSVAVDDDEIETCVGMTGDEWDTLTPEQRLTTLMAVQEAGEEPVSESVLERARQAYRRHPYAS